MLFVHQEDCVNLSTCENNDDTLLNQNLPPLKAETNKYLKMEALIAQTLSHAKAQTFKHAKIFTFTVLNITYVTHILEAIKQNE